MLREFPYSNFHELNLDWIMGKVSELEGTIDEKVTDRVDTKIDKMAEDGSFDNIIEHVVGGRLDAKQDKLTAGNGIRIEDNVISAIGDPAEELPDYWKEYIDEKSTELTDLYESIGGHGFAFNFLTDVHWDNNYKMSPKVIKYIGEKTGIDEVVCGGDIVTGHSDKQIAIGELRDFTKAIRNSEPVILVGNHDGNTSDQTTASNEISKSELYTIIDKGVENLVTFEPGGLYGYRDNKSQKVRFIYLNSGYVPIPNYSDDNLRYSTEQMEWMAQRISELPVGWSVLIFTHIFYKFTESGSVVHGIGDQLLGRLEAMYNTVNADIIGVVCGHTHRPISGQSNAGWLIIGTTSDARKAPEVHDGIVGTPGTITEQAFDVYFVDTKAKVIKTVRIGAGDGVSDRSFRYGSIDILDGATWNQNGVNTDGTPTAITPYRISTDLIPVTPGTIRVVEPSGKYWGIQQYTSSGANIGASGWKSGSQNFELASNVGFIRAMQCKVTSPTQGTDVPSEHITVGEQDVKFFKRNA